MLLSLLLLLALAPGPACGDPRPHPRERSPAAGHAQDLPTGEDLARTLGVDPESNTGWIEAIRPDHPRLFFNADTWPAVRERALGPERAWFDEVRRMVDSYPDRPTAASRGTGIGSRRTSDGSYEKVEHPRPTEWGTQAMQTAFVWLVTGEPAYLEKAKRMLAASVEAYRLATERGMDVNHYSFTRIGALAAYDWLHGDLTPGERSAILGPLLTHVARVQPEISLRRIYKLSAGDPTTGFYGTPSLTWYAGLAGLGDGVDDATARTLLVHGRRAHLEVLAHRARTAGDDGGPSSATFDYGLGAYPWAEFNFLLTWRSATGEDLAPEWPHLALLPRYVDWNWIRADVPREFGSGDAFHYDNALKTDSLYSHMALVRALYGSTHPTEAALAADIQGRLPQDERRFVPHFALHPFFLPEPQTPMKALGATRELVHARHFEGLGQIFMRSGTGVHDTYALFTIGAQVDAHKQYDEGHFTIYRDGFLALDSGTRGTGASTHLRHYYAQTVAHNCVLIHREGEELPGYWGPQHPGKFGRLNYGGMVEPIGGTCVAFETNDDYSYVAADTTACYGPKARRVTRQFLFVMPDYFVIFDRVTSDRAGDRKEWLFHTKNEPRIVGDTFLVHEGSGRLACRTLFPPDARLEKVGGAGRAFATGEHNWETEEKVAQRWAEKGYAGAWRMEVEPGAPRERDAFLHLIQVGDTSLEKMTPSELLQHDGQLGVRFEVGGGRAFRAMFATEGPLAGRIQVEKGGKIVEDRALTTSVQPQSG